MIMSAKTKNGNKTCLFRVATTMAMVFVVLVQSPFPVSSVLRPIASESRTLTNLDGMWRVVVDPLSQGDAERWWLRALVNTTAAPVPATLNDVLQLDGYFGVVWYERAFFVPRNQPTSDFSLYFESATANAQVWANGVRLGSHRGVGLPFGWHLEEEALIRGGVNRVTVRVDGMRTWQDLPPGATTISKYGQPLLYGGDAGYYYSTPGIDGSVWLQGVPTTHVITSVNTQWDGTRLHFNVSCNNIDDVNDCGNVTVSLEDHDDNIVIASDNRAIGVFEPTNPKLWWPIGSKHGTPFRYTLHTRTHTDHYFLYIGLRTVTTVGPRILVNNKLVYLRGADHHIDGHLRGHGVDRVLNMMDMVLMQQTRLNAFRVNSWPIPEVVLDLCDELGFMVQSEVPGIALRQGWDPACDENIFNPGGHCANATTLHNHKQAFADLYTRDRNRASVISFSMANEPDDSSGSVQAISYFNSLMHFARDFTNNNTLLTIEGVSDPQFYQQVHTDIVAVHNYPGWYDYCPTNQVTNEMSLFLATWSAALPNTPLIISEYGAGALPGHHTLSSLQFTEESQVAILVANHAAFDLFRHNNTLAGEHVHAWSDFQQTGTSVAQSGGARGLLLDVDGLNFKGLFSRTRQPKAAAALIRRRYEMIANEDWC